jgi:hypothetical protein
MLYPLSFGNNPLFPQASDFAVIAKDHKNGHGVITYRSFEPGDLLAIVAGEVVSDIRQHTLQISKRRHMFDPYFTGYLLHSCDPNVSLNMRKKTLTALKPIKANDYLYMDYAETEDVLFRQFACCCGSEKCRGWITGRKEQPHQIIIESHEHVHTH